ncbi:uncharacterized protein FIBRA_00650 [Fibroporia radiculosa]|uniref:Ribosomal L1 domain-containing protein 1 n=1 Tax=Fibroporia radiculosa TaxID=599839 RepID=J4G0J0_9APHY|nr:uncharacterized protein FIBRA_00650 [Fibroporia radiculosa]CCL98648.1 predicted protein [Fibroporia radiculosa]
MPKKVLIDSHVSEKQSKRALNALLTHAIKEQEKKAEQHLLPGKEQNIWLVITTKQMHPGKNMKPARIPIVHPLVDPRVSSVCLITKDPQREYKDLLESHQIRFISRVVGITKLKGKFKPFEARRLLLKENDLFLADERVVPLLPGLLGSKFFQAKKQPIPVCLTKKDLKGELERAISSTYFHRNQGTSIKVGILSQSPSQIIDNLKTALPVVVKKIQGGWDNMQSLHIKTNSSVSLPIWSCDLGGGEGGRWDGLTAGASSDEESGKAGSEEDTGTDGDDAEKPKGKHAVMEALSTAEVTEPTKGKKRAAEENMDMPQRKKREKSSQHRGKSSESRGSKKSKTDTVVQDPPPTSPPPPTVTPTTTTTGTASLSTMPKDELKKKRSAMGGERKKVKMVNSILAAKSAKEAIVGKKRH